MVKVSVIIPCFNQGKYIQEAINSVLSSTFEDFEIVIVNDGSNDCETVEILNKISHKKIKIIHQENQGVCAARNKAITHSSGEYILPLDGDDKIAPTYIEKAFEIIENNPNIGIVYCEAEFFGLKNEKWILPDFSKKRLLNGNIIFCSGMYRKKDWEKVGGYKNEFKDWLEDWEFWISLIELGVDAFKISEVLFYYRLGDNCQTRKMNRALNIENYRKVFKYHAQMYADNYEHLPLFFNFMAHGFNKSIVNTKLNKKWNLKISLEPRL